MALQNAKLASEIRLTQQAGTPPALPGGAKSIIAGQGDARIATDPDSAPLSLVLPRTDDSGKDRWVAGRATNSQTIADMYGDAAQELYGMARLGIDAYRNLVKPYVDPALKAAAQKVLEADRALPPLPKRRRFVGRYGGGDFMRGRRSMGRRRVSSRRRGSPRRRRMSRRRGVGAVRVGFRM